MWIGVILTNCRVNLSNKHSYSTFGTQEMYEKKIRKGKGKGEKKEKKKKRKECVWYMIERNREKKRKLW